jgi:hypothetical protein
MKKQIAFAANRPLTIASNNPSHFLAPNPFSLTIPSQVLAITNLDYLFPALGGLCGSNAAAVTNPNSHRPTFPCIPRVSWFNNPFPPRSGQNAPVCPIFPTQLLEITSSKASTQLFGQPVGKTAAATSTHPHFPTQVLEITDSNQLPFDQTPASTPCGNDQTNTSKHSRPENSNTLARSPFSLTVPLQVPDFTHFTPKFMKKQCPCPEPTLTSLEDGHPAQRPRQSVSLWTASKSQMKSCSGVFRRAAAQCAKLPL